MDVEAIKRRGWVEDGIIVINIETDVMDWDDRERFRLWAERRYGKRGDKR